MSSSFQKALLNVLSQLPREGGGIYRVYHFATQPVLCKYPIELSGGGTFSQSSMIHRLILIAHQTTGTESPAFVCGMEVMEYKEKTTDQTPSLAYISKVDTTGYKAPAPITSLLVKSYLATHSNCTTHIFARAQPQYLFHRSVENPSKHTQSDRGLISWWLRAIGGAPFLTQLDAWWCIPGVDDQEIAKRETRVTHDLKLGRVKWHYGYSYDDNADPKAVIPKFPDDAKARLLKSYANYDSKDDSDEDEDEEEDEEEDAEEDGKGDNDKPENHTNEDEREASASSPMNNSDTNSDNDDGEGSTKQDATKHEKIKDILDEESHSMTVREFWELLSIGEECGSGKLTGFFVIKGDATTNLSEESKELAQTLTKDQFTIIWNHLMANEFTSDESNRASTAKFTEQINECLQLEPAYKPIEADPVGESNPEFNKSKRPLQQEKQSVPTVNVLDGGFIKRRKK
ncbi:histone H3-K56 acetyltransferase [Umbelopsis sp. PMI_123]|nr:histone H3-K56 acetyltransferase [Umbelopsis sp. PMI_123]